MAENTESSNGQTNGRNLLRYGGASVLVFLVLLLLLGPSRTERQSYGEPLIVADPEVPATTVATKDHPADPNLFTAETMGDAWPFNGISSATVECRKGMYAVLVADNGTTYALDAAAGNAVRTGTEDFIKLDAIRRRSDGDNGAHITIEPLLKRGAEVCGN